MTPQTQDDVDTTVYPDCDGQPVAENTLQFQWITTIQGNLNGMFRHTPDVFVAGDLLWYPVRGDATIRVAPDAMVVFGRPRGHRGSYQQWREGGIAPQVVFEVLSPGNRQGEMDDKFAFYDQRGVEEYYIYDPDRVELQGWQRRDGSLQPILTIDGWVSPRLGIRFDMSGPELVICDPSGKRFLTFEELMEQDEQLQQEAKAARAETRLAQAQVQEAQAQTRQAQAQVEEAQAQTKQAEARAEHAEVQVEQAQAQTREAQAQAEQAQARAQRGESEIERLAAMLRALGVDPKT
jgi:Uma2 family endonuclease